MEKHISSSSTPTSCYSSFLDDMDKRQAAKYLSYACRLDLYSMMHQNYKSSFSQYDTESSGEMCYLRWQEDHEVNFGTEPHPQEKVITKATTPEQTKVTINVSIRSLEDILTLINTVEYDPTKSYNIDLQSLHKIKIELSQLNEMIGLESLKTDIVKQLLYFIQGFADDSTHGDYKHTVLTGPPGTGKTELAKLIGTIYSKIGILKSNIFKKVTRGDLIAGYLGQTAIKTRKVIDECLGGVLFIDEAYSLQVDDMFAKECVDTLCEALSDNKKNFMVIIAGYETDLNETFFKINKGLDSRFLWRFKIESYSIKELYKIYCYIVTSRSWQVHKDVTEQFFQLKKDKLKDNGRGMEQLFLFSKIAHAQRIYGKEEEERKKITLDDLTVGLRMFEEHMNLKKDKISFGLYI
jgi:Holliday junction resolvasome RuvABC ATP-dependent DNA helicase subunit